MATNSALPLPPDKYDKEYMNRLIRQINFAIQNLSTVTPLTAGSDLSGQIRGYPISALTLVDIPTSPTNLPPGSVWSDGGVLKITS